MGDEFGYVKPNRTDSFRSRCADRRRDLHFTRDLIRVTQPFAGKQALGFEAFVARGALYWEDEIHRVGRGFSRFMCEPTRAGRRRPVVWTRQSASLRGDGGLEHLRVHGRSTCV